MRKNQLGPPCDLRYLRKKGLLSTPKSAEVHSFLARIYESIAETLPDVRDEPDVDMGSVKEFRFELDAYAVALQKKQAGSFQSVAGFTQN